MAPTAAALLAAWEAGAVRPALQRAPSLLGSLQRLESGRPVDELTVGECDRRLGALYAELFGDRVELVAVCPGCRSEVEVTLSVTELLPAVAPAPAAARGPGPTVTVQCDGVSVSCRVPRNGDLDAVAAIGSGDSLGELIGRCLVDARDEAGRSLSPAQLPPETVSALVQALADGDPGAQIPLGIRCGCGTAWVDEFDIRGAVWAELTDWVGRTMTTVHQLARSYGWSEPEILAMSGWRRRWYVEAAGW